MESSGASSLLHHLRPLLSFSAPWYAVPSSATAQICPQMWREAVTFYRGEGKLFVAGNHTGRTQLFDVGTRAIPRSLEDHKQWSCDFSTPCFILTRPNPVLGIKLSPDNTSPLSRPDDATVHLFNIPSSMDTLTIYVPDSFPQYLVLSGSYDGNVRLFDAHAGGSEMVMPRKSPVKDVLLFPSGVLSLSAWGPVLRVRDLVAGGKYLRTLSSHRERITSLASLGDYLPGLSDGLEQMVKVSTSRAEERCFQSAIQRPYYTSPFLSMARVLQWA
ncbi:hypothetical protein CALCODRAFT_280287 [Calocera cornea HHB12733]|uniref:WD40 repeat-like protein n=1 Tax=Calocera cornea HHB12733 TaxID=1353952 RepID=A0A165JSL6_9BASI|nr:hypothetical protein CALCODRAFT_280287 [Calocera cornea HHB12733]